LKTRLPALEHEHRAGKAGNYTKIAHFSPPVRRAAWIDDLRRVCLKNGVNSGSPGRPSVDRALARLSVRSLRFSRKKPAEAGFFLPEMLR
jgi:hypothetical protein